MSSLVGDMRKKRPKNFSMERYSFFQKIVFPTTFQVLQKGYYIFHSNCQKTFAHL